MAAARDTRIDNETVALAGAWRAVATSDEVAERPVAVELLGERWALARLNGRLVAFADRRPHRLAPLSIGTVCAETLQCAYHGWTCDAGGRVSVFPRSDRRRRSLLEHRCGHRSRSRSASG